MHHLRHFLSSGALIAMYGSALSEWLSRYGLSNVTALCSLVGTMVLCWTKIPQIVGTWYFVAGGIRGWLMRQRGFRFPKAGK